MQTQLKKRCQDYTYKQPIKFDISSSQFDIHLYICTWETLLLMPEEIKRRRKQTRRHLEKWEIPAIMKDDKYVFYIVSEMNTVGNSSGEKCHLVKKNKKISQKIICCRRYWWIKFSNLWHKQLFQMSQYLLGNNTFSRKTTFVNETNTFYQHVDRSPRIWLWGPHKGSQAKLQYFSKRPLGFLLAIIIWMLFWRSLICILMLCPCSI